ncbi:MAG TPA: GtrA family protein [Pseudoxanthomonas sp.]|nr:GtrA family protein [Pseudoxanthomonas sp.]
MLVGLLQLLLDWGMFVALTSFGLSAPTGNVLGRVSGALLGFWLNGRTTFAVEGQPRLGWHRFGRFLIVWTVMTVASTVAMGWIANRIGLHHAWLAKPLVDGALAVAAFFLSRQLVYR